MIALLSLAVCIPQQSTAHLLPVQFRAASGVCCGWELFADVGGGGEEWL